MTAHKLKSKQLLALLVVIIALILPSEIIAQRMGHGVSRGGSGHSISRGGSSRTMSRPSTTHRTPSRTINGGHVKSPSRNISNNRNTKPALTNKATAGKAKVTNKPTIKNRKTSTVERKNINRGNGNRNINIDNSKNVNINRKNTHVRSSHNHYNRPPHHYGGYNYYCHRPYYYHPYRPFYWGPVWHPWGYFITTMATTAIIVSIANDSSNDEYHYDNGTYYLKTEDGFVAVQAPVGAEVPSIPQEAQEVQVNETNNYYYGGAFYEKNADGYIVVPATAGTIVPGLPEGGDEVKIGDVTYVQFGDTYYQPIQVDGKDMYEIVEVKAE